MSLRLEQLLIQAKKLGNKILEADYSNPVNVLILGSVVILPWVAAQFVMTGLLLGLLLCLSVLWTVDHLPNGLKQLIKNNPIVSDFVLSTIALLGVGSMFGHGLVLAFGAIICGIVLGWCIPHIQIRTTEKSLIVI